MEKQRKKAPVKSREDQLYISALYADFCPCPKSVIITTLNHYKHLFIVMRQYKYIYTRPNSMSLWYMSRFLRENALRYETFFLIAYPYFFLFLCKLKKH